MKNLFEENIKSIKKVIIVVLKKTICGCFSYSKFKRNNSLEYHLNLD